MYALRHGHQVVQAIFVGWVWVSGVLVLVLFYVWCVVFVCVLVGWLLCMVYFEPIGRLGPVS